MQIVVEKNLSLGQNGRVGRVPGNETFLFLPNIEVCNRNDRPK